MALLVYDLRRPPPPLDYVTESVFEIPATRGMRLVNRRLRLIFILDGEARLQILNGPPTPLQAGDVIVLPTPTPYAYLPLIPGQPGRIQALAVSVRASTLARQITKRFPRAIHLPGIQTAGMLHSLYQMRSEVETGGPDSVLAAGAHATLLVLALLRAQNVEVNPPSRPNRSGKHLVEQAREFISKNYEEKLTLSGIAWHLRLSEEYLARLFKKETGQTVFDCVREIRLNVAKRLLAGTNVPVGRIAEMSGFSGAGVFCRAFRQAFRQTPAGYRAGHSGNLHAAFLPNNVNPSS